MNCTRNLIFGFLFILLDFQRWFCLYHSLNSNADRASWWELMVLSTHVHPSVATMAATLLSGANIVYNGNPLNDLSMTAFLDKFMEKKPKASSWHGGSQIEPAKKVSLNFPFKDLLLLRFTCGAFWFPCHAID